MQLCPKAAAMVRSVITPRALRFLAGAAAVALLPLTVSAGPDGRRVTLGANRAYDDPTPAATLPLDQMAATSAFQPLAPSYPAAAAPMPLNAAEESPAADAAEAAASRSNASPSIVPDAAVAGEPVRVADPSLGPSPAGSSPTDLPTDDRVAGVAVPAIPVGASKTVAVPASSHAGRAEKARGEHSGMARRQPALVVVKTASRPEGRASEQKRVHVAVPTARVAVRDGAVRVAAPYTRVAVDDGRVRVRAPFVNLDIRF